MEIVSFVERLEALMDLEVVVDEVVGWSGRVGGVRHLYNGITV